LRRFKLSQIITSPYVRALETAGIIAEYLGLPIAVEPLVAERFCFTCDIGSPLAELQAGWPQLVFDHLPDPWWPRMEETEEVIRSRAETFRCRILNEAWSEVALVTHWGVIRAMTGRNVPNGAVLRIDPTKPNCGPELVFIPHLDPPEANR
jgi:broad specificity phosphatase PhoE